MIKQKTSRKAGECIDLWDGMIFGLKKLWWVPFEKIHEMCIFS